MKYFKKYLSIVGFFIITFNLASAAKIKTPSLKCEEAMKIQNSAGVLYLQKHYTQAHIEQRRALKLAKSACGPDHPDTAIILNGLGAILHAQLHFREAEQILRYALDIWKRVNPSDNIYNAYPLLNLALVCNDTNHFDEAKSFLERAIKVADLMRSIEKYEEAETLYHAALPITGKIFGSDSFNYILNNSNLGMVILYQNRYDEAEIFLQSSLEISKKVFPPHDLRIAETLNNLGGLLREKGDLFEAEKLFRQAWDLYEKSQQFNDPSSIMILINLAGILQNLGRHPEALTYYQRTFSLANKVLSPEDPLIATLLSNLGFLLMELGRYDEAEENYRKAVNILDKEPIIEPRGLSICLDNLGRLLANQDRLNEAEPLIRRALLLSQQQSDTAHIYTSLATLYQGQGDLSKAEYAARKAIKIFEKINGPNNLNTVRATNHLAKLLYAQDQTPAAESYLRQAVAIIQKTNSYTDILSLNYNLGFILIKRRQLQEALPYYRAAADALDQLFSQTQGLAEEVRYKFLGQYSEVYREFLDLLLKLHEKDAKAGYDREFLAVASRNQSRMFSELLRQGDVARFASNPDFVQLKEQRQTLLNQLGVLTEKRVTVSSTAPNAEGQKAAFSQRIEALQTELTQTEERLWRDYPRYMELLSFPRPVTVEQLQGELLQPGEVLLSFVLLPDRAATLALSRDRFALNVAPLTTEVIGQRVKALRASLPSPAQGEADPTLTLERLEPADLHALYRDLIAPVEPILKEAQRIIVVADGPLYGLPLEMLITDDNEAQQTAFRATRSRATGTPNRPALLAEYAGLPYLADRYTFRYLPSLAALVSQRRYPKPATPITHPLIAFADPVFNSQEDAASTTATRGYTPATEQTLALLTRSGATSGPLARLPETADEARALAAAVSGTPRLYLRQDAQEHTVKQLAQASELKGVRYLLFATHGLLGGEFLPPVSSAEAKDRLLDLNKTRRATPLDPRGQPALALTLVDPTQGEDGLLTLKEVIEDLDLNVDLAILSACNTVGDTAKATTGEGFAGLTRAFLFAGARHLWVSHWYVESAAARDLTTEAVRTLQARPDDPAAALTAAAKKVRDSVVPLNQNSDHTSRQLARAHPYFWAPFVTVGD